MDALAAPGPAWPPTRYRPHSMVVVRHLDGLDALVAELADVATDADAAEALGTGLLLDHEAGDAFVGPAAAGDPARWPFVTHVFVQLMTNSPPSWSPAPEHAACRCPASGRSERAADLSARESQSDAAFCSLGPHSPSGELAHITWVLSTPDEVHATRPRSPSITPQ